MSYVYVSYGGEIRFHHEQNNLGDRATKRAKVIEYCKANQFDVHALVIIAKIWARNENIELDLPEDITFGEPSKDGRLFGDIANARLRVITFCKNEQLEPQSLIEIARIWVKNSFTGKK